VPYDTRAKLEASSNRPPVLVWVDDPVDNFFLQIQGSGRVRLSAGPDAGKTIRVAYADHNGQPYVSIARWLVERGELSLAQASMQNIRLWARRNPRRVTEMLNANPAVVFFREEPLIDPEQGPKGAYGIPLAPQRSIAVDAAFVPLGTPVFLSTTWPASARPLQRLVFAQDSGAAIKGAGRADFYWGYAEAAGQQAGRMKQSGQMWVLWPKEAGEPSAR
jgi:membrane-bound lytic murein transglycosylase A